MISKYFSHRIFVAALAMLILGWTAQSAVAQAIYTSTGDGVIVNENVKYESKPDVYLNGGPQGPGSAGFPEGIYYYEVTTPNGALLSTDEAACRQLEIENNSHGRGVVHGIPAVPVPGTCSTGLHLPGSLNATNGSIPIQLVPFDDTPNPGGEYKVWMWPAFGPCAPSTQAGIPAFLFDSASCRNSSSKTDNFKVKESGPQLVHMPIQKYINGNLTSCQENSVDTPDSPLPGDTTTTTTTVCQANPNVIGTWTQVCNSLNGGAPLCDAPVIAYLPKFQANLYTNVDGDPTQPDNFIDGSCAGAELAENNGGLGCLGAVFLPPLFDPDFPAGVPFSACEINLPAGWYLPDGGITLTAFNAGGGSQDVPTAVYTPVSTPSAGDRNRCFNTVIPPLTGGQTTVEFHVDMNNIPVGGIVISKESIGGTGIFNFTASGDGDCQKAETNTPPNHNPALVNFTNICTGLPTDPIRNTTENNPDTDDELTGDGVLPVGGAPPDAYTVDARINTNPPIDDASLPAPYAAAENDPGSDWTPGTTSCAGTIQEGPLGNTGFGVAPNEIVTCSFINYRNPQINLSKSCEPRDDGGTFDLHIGGTDLPGASCGSTLGPVTVPFEIITVSESNGNPDLSNYASSISCEVSGGGTGPIVGGSPTTWTVDLRRPNVWAGKTINCTILNRRKPELKLVKNLIPSDDPGLFDLNIGGDAPEAEGVGDGGETPFVVVDFGPVGISEAGNGTDLSGYFKSLSCSAGVVSGSGPNWTVDLTSVDPGTQVTCTITNAAQFCSFTQGAWFAPPRGGNPSKSYLYPYFDTAWPGDLVVGGTNSIQFSGASNVSAATPGGTPKVLDNGTFTNIKAFQDSKKITDTGNSGNFGSQTTALKINVELGNVNAFDPLPGIGGLLFTGLSGPNDYYNGKSVANLLADAEAALGGDGLPAGYTGTINSLTGFLGDNVNPSWDGCRPTDWALEHYQ